MGELYEALKAALAVEAPIALATVVEGPVEQLGAKLLVQPGAAPLGTLGDPDLDRVTLRTDPHHVRSGAQQLSAPSRHQWGTPSVCHTHARK